jgi:predicted dehydrogenase
MRSILADVESVFNSLCERGSGPLRAGGATGYDAPRLAFPAARVRETERSVMSASGKGRSKGRTKVRVTIIGCGGMARHHIRQILKQRDTTAIPVVCETSEAAYAATQAVFKEAGVAAPPNEPDLARLLERHAGRLHAAFIITPHASHHDQAKACMEAGLDVLIEKPMVVNAAEAHSLINIRDRTGRLLVVAFPGSLSPQIRKAAEMSRSGELGRLMSLSATVWQKWGSGTVNSWRQKPEISGGGFLFDTGAHLLNTVVDLAGEEFAEVAAWMDTHGRPVETHAVVIGRLASGALATLHAFGEAIPSCASEILVFYSDSILRTGVWGERLELERTQEKGFAPVSVPPSLGVWQQFLAVRAGRLPNPCPPEVGLRMARLYDAIKRSAAQGGAPVPCA